MNSVSLSPKEPFWIVFSLAHHPQEGEQGAVTCDWLPLSMEINCNHHKKLTLLSEKELEFVRVVKARDIYTCLHELFWQCSPTT